MARNLRVLEAARALVDEINLFIDRSPKRLLYGAQLRESVASIAANIREGFGRLPGRERTQFFRIARGSAEEADEHMRANFAARRVPTKMYWRTHNRLVVIRRMVTALMHE